LLAARHLCRGFCENAAPRRREIRRLRGGRDAAQRLGTTRRTPEKRMLTLAPLPQFDALPLEHREAGLDPAVGMEIALLCQSMSVAKVDTYATLTVFAPVTRPAAEYSTF
jgi:hypothetical protein